MRWKHGQDIEKKWASMTRVVARRGYSQNSTGGRVVVSLLFRDHWCSINPINRREHNSREGGLLICFFIVDDSSVSDM